MTDPGNTTTEKDGLCTPEPSFLFFSPVYSV